MRELKNHHVTHFSQIMSETRTIDHVARAIEEYMKINQLFVENCPWQIKKSPLGGFGIFAKRDIQAGDLIFIDSPVILGPRCSDVSVECCFYCFTKSSDVKICEKRCGLLICLSCKDGEGIRHHQDECKLIRSLSTDQDLVKKSTTMIKCLTPLRSLLLTDKDKQVVKILKSHKGNQHGREIDLLTDELHFKISEEDRQFLMIVCSVLDANAFEVSVANGKAQTSFRGLFPLGSLANHSCFPNAFHVFDENRRMVTRASVFIEKGSEIFHSYSRLIWGTATRSMHLRKTKHFVCRCNRCLDPTEFGTYMSSILCKSCQGNLIPIDPLACCPWSPNSTKCPRDVPNWYHSCPNVPDMKFLSVGRSRRCEGCKETVPLKDVARVFSLIGSVMKCFDEGDFVLMNSFLKGKLASLVPESSQVVIQIKYKIVWILGYHESFLWKDLSADLLALKKAYCFDVLELLKKLNIGFCKMRGLLLYEIYQCLTEIKQRKNNNEVDDEYLSVYLDEAADILRYDVTSPDVIKQKWRT